MSIRDIPDDVQRKFADLSAMDMTSIIEDNIKKNSERILDDILDKIYSKGLGKGERVEIRKVIGKKLEFGTERYLEIDTVKFKDDKIVDMVDYGYQFGLNYWSFHNYNIKICTHNEVKERILNLIKYNKGNVKAIKYALAMMSNIVESDWLRGGLFIYKSDNSYKVNVNISINRENGIKDKKGAIEIIRKVISEIERIKFNGERDTVYEKLISKLYKDVYGE